MCDVLVGELNDRALIVDGSEGMRISYERVND